MKASVLDFVSLSVVVALVVKGSEASVKQKELHDSTLKTPLRRRLKVGHQGIKAGPRREYDSGRSKGTVNKGRAKGDFDEGRGEYDKGRAKGSKGMRGFEESQIHGGGSREAFQGSASGKKYIVKYVGKYGRSTVFEELRRKDDCSEYDSYEDCESYEGSDEVFGEVSFEGDPKGGEKYLGKYGQESDEDEWSWKGGPDEVFVEDSYEAYRNGGEKYLGKYGRESDEAEWRREEPTFGYDSDEDSFAYQGFDESSYEDEDDSYEAGDEHSESQYEGEEDSYEEGEYSESYEGSSEY